MKKTLIIPFDKATAKSLKAGEYVYLSGTLYAARDAAHKRMTEALARGEALPFDLAGNTMYYMRLSENPAGHPMETAAPTTASRMDPYTPALLELGMNGMIGKGRRSQAVLDAIVKNGAVYFAAVGGAGVRLSQCIKACEVAAYEDLGLEAVYKLQIEDFPAIVVIDTEGNDLYKMVMEGM